jgi:hypothetical protein
MPHTRRQPRTVSAFQIGAPVVAPNADSARITASLPTVIAPMQIFPFGRAAHGPRGPEPPAAGQAAWAVAACRHRGRQPRIPAPVGRGIMGAWKPVAAGYALVSPRLKVDAWTKTETSHGELLVSCTKNRDEMPGQSRGG